MSTRRKPVKAVGEVNVLAPSAKSPYFRLTWIEPDGRHGGTTGGRTLDQAMSKAAEIDAGLQRATGPKALTPLGQVMEEYLASPVRRNQKTKKDWSPSHHRQAKQVLHRVLRGYESCPALAVDRTMADLMRAQAGTWRTVDENTSMLRGPADPTRFQRVSSAESQATAVRTMDSLWSTSSAGSGGLYRLTSRMVTCRRARGAPR